MYVIIDLSAGPHMAGVLTHPSGQMALLFASVEQAEAYAKHTAKLRKAEYRVVSIV